MDLLTLPLYEALVVIAKVTFIFCWAIMLLTIAIRIILRSIMDELVVHEEE